MSNNRKEKIKMSSVIVGFGNTGNNIVCDIAVTSGFEDSRLFSIDSVASSVSINDTGKVKTIPIISDDKSGSGRDRNRGKAMYKFHEKNGSFDELYLTCDESSSPVFVITSAAGGTGSGAVVPFCEYLIKNDIHVIPVIVCPNEKDPDAYHMNASDLLLELDSVGVSTYATFINPDNSNYTSVNKEVVEAIKVMLGKYYGNTNKDSIDDSDLETVLNWPGRLLAVAVNDGNNESVGKNLLRKVFWGHQRGWDPNDKNLGTLITAASLKSVYADLDYDDVFGPIYDKIPRVYDRYKHIDNSTGHEATIIVAGLPRPNIKKIDGDFNEASSIGSGIQKSTRPAFMKKKQSKFEAPTSGTNNNIAQFNIK